MFFKKKRERTKVTAIVLAAGESRRMGEKKEFIEILDKPAIAYSLLAFERAESVERIVVVTREQDILFVGDVCKTYGINKVVSIITGGAERSDSVRLGLDEATEAEYFAIHDGARPCITPEYIDRVVDAAIEKGAATLGHKATDTLKYARNGVITESIERENLWHLETPQCFAAPIIRAAHENGAKGTDDTGLVDVPVYIVESNCNNIKITLPSDLELAAAILGGREDV